ncbi:MAG TPA: GNAT family N-acetyltransferase [Longimicrobiales bacterium]|nr:GNAT family N-acetyltransferase [Longimicrobiales bacterium]
MSQIHPKRGRDLRPTDRPGTPPGRSPRLVRLPEERADEVVEVLAGAFRWYPVMKHVAGGEPGADAQERIRALVRFFVMARILSGHPVLGLEQEGDLVAAATLTPPEHAPAPPAVKDLRNETWDRLGAEARDRYDELGRIWGTFEFPPTPHHHLNMIGVIPDRAGRGLGRSLLDAVHGLVAAHGASSGVSLTTETRRNVELYRRAGYEVVAHEMIRAPDGTPALWTWGMFRPV